MLAVVTGVEVETLLVVELDPDPDHTIRAAVRTAHVSLDVLHSARPWPLLLLIPPIDTLRGTPEPLVPLRAEMTRRDHAA